MYRKKQVVFIPALCMMSIGLVFLFSTLATPARSERFLPFQGRLTDSAGNPVSDGSYKIRFKIFDAPMGGTAVWDGETHTATVNGGFVNVILGANAPFGDSFTFDDMLYLEITVDTNGDSVIDASDPPILPRQLIMPVIYSKDAGKLEGNRWSEFFTVPPGAEESDPAKNPTNARAKDTDLFDGIDSAAVFVDPSNLGSPKVKIVALADFATSGGANLNYKVGVLTESVSVYNNEGRKDFPGMTVNFTSTGRPVLVVIFAKGDFALIRTTEAMGDVFIQRDGNDIASMTCNYHEYCAFNLSCIDNPPAGEHTYKVQGKAFWGSSEDDGLFIDYFPELYKQEYKIIVFEL